MTAICLNCSAEFKRPNGRMKAKYCRQQCYFESQAKLSLSLKVEVKCPQCGKVELLTKGRAAVKTIGYCSDECHLGVKRVPRSLKQCPICNKTFTAVMGTGKIQRFCSRRCTSVYAVQAMPTNGTSIERAVDAMLSTIAIIYVPQFKLGYWVCDFFVPASNLVVECDGDYWHSLPKAILNDKRKDAWLKKHRYKLLRLTETEINNSPDLCLAKLKEAIGRC